MHYSLAFVKRFQSLQVQVALSANASTIATVCKERDEIEDTEATDLAISSLSPPTRHSQFRLPSMPSDLNKLRDNGCKCH